MKISLYSNRSFIVKVFLSFAIFIFIVIAMMSIALIVNYDEQKESIQVLIFFIVFFVIIVGVMLTLKFYKGKRYEFDENEIVCFFRKRENERIKVADIEGINFYRFKFSYIFTIFVGALNEGGCWKLHVRMKDGTKKELAFFSVKDIKMLKEKLYGDLITII